ncbi:hypothetical protein [Intestinibacter bartlettii]|uniref:hypothetical protein n=1 Tax=Intestinibacter bartlettii TaxID=261299 RepID=UPI00304F3704
MTKEEFGSKVKDLKAKHDAFLAALDDVLEARRYEIHDSVFFQEIEDMGRKDELRVARDNICQLRHWNPNK